MVSFRSFKICSDAKESVVCGKQREATAPIALGPEFAVVDMRSAEVQPRFLSCSEGPALGRTLS